jgi:hypothetical protein
MKTEILNVLNVVNLAKPVKIQLTIAHLVSIKLSYWEINVSLRVLINTYKLLPKTPVKNVTKLVPLVKDQVKTIALHVSNLLQ